MGTNVLCRRLPACHATLGRTAGSCDFLRFQIPTSIEFWRLNAVGVDGGGCSTGNNKPRHRALAPVRREWVMSRITRNRGGGFARSPPPSRLPKNERGWASPRAATGSRLLLHEMDRGSFRSTGRDGKKEVAPRYAVMRGAPLRAILLHPWSVTALTG